MFSRRVALAFWLTLALLSVPPLTIGFFVTPEDLESGRLVLTPPCPFKRMTGHDCPSCGLTRAFAALCHGRVRDAIAYHRGAPALYAFFLVALATGAIQAVRSGRRPRAVSIPLCSLRS